MSNTLSDNKFIRFLNKGSLWVKETSGEIVDEEIKSNELYHTQILPHIHDEYCHLLFSDGSLARDVKKEWFEIVE